MLLRNAIVVALLLVVSVAFGEGKENKQHEHMVERDNNDSLVTRELDLAATKSDKKRSENVGSKSSKKEKASKSPKKKKSPKKGKFGKHDKSSEQTKAEDELEENLQQAIVLRDELQKSLNFNAENKDLCEKASDDHQKCVYDLFLSSSSFDCECRPTSGAQIFKEVDANDDDDITLEEVLQYFDAKECVFPFKYEVNGNLNTYNSCTSDDDAFGQEWCSIKTLRNGVHAKGFFKYCKEEASVAAWNDALFRLDTNKDEKLSFDEAMANAKRRRQRRLSLMSTKYQCNDCSEDMPAECENLVVRAIDAECRNYIRTQPLNDDELLHMLAYAMEDSYCLSEDADKEGGYSTFGCPTKRTGMDKWITRTNVKLYESISPYQYLTCARHVLGDNYLLALTYDSLRSLFGQNANFVEQCKHALRNPFDGKDALQWATYNINQGEHAGKKILAYMGTQGNVEQVLADLWSVPTANYMLRNMADEASQVAVDQNADFITGHSLGGIIAEMVCSQTGIPGASFAALGAFDPFSKSDQVKVDNVLDGNDGEILKRIRNDYTDALFNIGYSIENIQTMLENENEEQLRRVLVSTEYNGLISNTLHHGVKFEVVMNSYDLLARPLCSIDGSACSHITSSCNVRWLWFGISGTTGGHSSQHYTYNTRTKYTTGWQAYESVNYDMDKLFLEGVERNIECDYCVDSRYCESGSCDLDGKQCLLETGKKSTFCPNRSSKPGKRSTCDNNDECESGRCAWSWFDGADYFCYE